MNMFETYPDVRNRSFFLSAENPGYVFILFLYMEEISSFSSSFGKMWKKLACP